MTVRRLAEKRIDQVQHLDVVGVTAEFDGARPDIVAKRLHPVDFVGGGDDRVGVLGGKVAEIAVGVDNWSFVGGDGVGSVVECGADVIDGRLARFYV